MRNLKKFLALVLALMMVVSVMVTVSAADFSSTEPGTAFDDDASITAKYDEAIQVLEGLKVLQGDTDGNLNPGDPISRAEMAAIAYRINTGKTEAKAPDVYAGASEYTDVTASHWAYGFINYCDDNGLIFGDPDGSFRPDDNVTGYEVITILLRALGYDKRDELKGEGFGQRAAKFADEIGITANIGANQLSKDATREMVADMTFRAIAKASMVKYNLAQLDYVPVDGIGKTGSTDRAGMTLGWKVFKLYGGLSKGVDSSVTAPVTSGTGTYNYDRMTTRFNAVVDGKYDAPAAYWYANGKAISVEFTPVLTYKTAVTEETVHADLGLGKTDAPDYKYSIDGYDIDGLALQADTDSNPANDTYVGCGTNDGKIGNNRTGKGVLTEVYDVDDQIFITSVNTYVDTTDVASGTAWKMTHASDAQDDASAKSDVAKGTVVIWQGYRKDTVDKDDGGVTAGSNMIDSSTIHAATKLDLTLTSTYMETDPVKYPNRGAYSSFTAGGQTYEYNNLYFDGPTGYPGGRFLSHPLLDRNTLGNATRQLVWLDDYGYVVHTKAWEPDANATGYLLLRSGEYEKLVADNWWVVDFNVILPDGTQTVVSGAVNGSTGAVNSHYARQADASSAKAATLGLYTYEIIDGYYKLYPVRNSSSVGEVVPGVAGTKLVDSNSSYWSGINAGDPAALGDGNLILDDETVFFIAKYEASSSKIVGYDRVVGFKNIGDLTARTGDKADTAAGNASGKLFVEWVCDPGDDNTGVYVFVRNADRHDDSVGTATAAKAFYLLDNDSTSAVDTHDTHVVVGPNGKESWNFVKYEITRYSASNPYTLMRGENEFYTYTDTVNGLYHGVNGPESKTAVSYAGVGVLAKSGGGYIVLADNCVVYQITATGTVTTLTKDEVADVDFSTYGNVYVGATDAYGFATLLYLAATVAS